MEVVSTVQGSRALHGQPRAALDLSLPRAGMGDPNLLPFISLSQCCGNKHPSKLILQSPKTP